MDDPSGRKRTNEEEYFQKRDRELIEQMRQRAKAQQELRELGERVGVTDPELSRELAELGFTPETVKLLPLIPVLEMAWAEGEVTAAERKMVVDAARGRGMTVSIGRLRPCAVLDWKLVALGHNTVRGAAGASVLNAELMQAEGLLG